MEIFKATGTKASYDWVDKVCRRLVATTFALIVSYKEKNS